MSLLSSSRAASLTFGLALAAMAGYAATSNAAFEVRISLSPPNNSGLCLSESLGSATQAAVNVVCSTGQFVSIEAQPGRPYLGTHGGAFEYAFASRTAFSTRGGGGAADLYAGPGTVTSLRVYRPDGAQTPVEMLVSF